MDLQKLLISSFLFANSDTLFRLGGLSEMSLGLGTRRGCERLACLPINSLWQGRRLWISARLSACEAFSLAPLGTRRDHRGMQLSELQGYSDTRLRDYNVTQSQPRVCGFGLSAVLRALTMCPSAVARLRSSFSKMPGRSPKKDIGLRLCLG